MRDAAAIREAMRREILATGASAAGFCRCEPVAAADTAAYNRWLADGMAADMAYMKRNDSLRTDPASLLDGCKTIISVAFNYNSPRRRNPSLPKIARYALGRDYHKALPALLRPLCRRWEAVYGCKTRICTDSAPLRERYHAMRAGIAFRGRNGMAIIPGTGSFFLLAEILTTLELPADTPNADECLGCDACLEACPNGAIRGDGLIDASRCISYLTIEAPGTDNSLTHNHLFGCDICQEVCPHNALAPFTTIADFMPRQGIADLDSETLRNLDEEAFDRLTAGSPLRRAGLQGLKSNLAVSETSLSDNNKLQHSVKNEDDPYKP